MRSRWLLVVASCACGLAGLAASPALADNTWRIESSGTLQSLYAVSFVDYNQGLAVGSNTAQTMVPEVVAPMSMPTLVM